ncbi:hypothetical protein K6119_09135 [Paracrocinitomix mangrovi]|uniref:hypothetical protein n=1 Tax=Paracrocinitomix mangrovi TaxID=2862509 RepID=UPI001C8DB25E|nr:hypothetical protein [Paracrocinitomix mangrovi]UKN03676.1 hypothetical protein K6119_09135 [Paracrocinitomix mangrovi]
MQVTIWDALGYYQYLPATFIYNDVDKLAWYEKLESKYNLSGGEIYQYQQLENGNKVAKYTAGVAIMQSPFFLLAHSYALLSDYEADGFSAPYQYAIAYGMVLYFILALFILRKILLRYYDDTITSITLILITLATNTLQYVAAEAGMSHGYIFLLYSLLIWFTIKWHDKPTFKYSALIGFTVGFAAICRITDAVMILIPILWGISDKESLKQKIKLLKENSSLLLWCAAFGILAILPQIMYWWYVTGSPLHKMGSKWQFLDPWFRVLTGFEKGWFIYTPVTIFMIIGLFLIRKKEFRVAVGTLAFINIWIIISWHEWRYGASYSTRALVQSYPVLALPLAAFISHSWKKHLRYLVSAIAIILCSVNIFQIHQYNKGILIGDGMNFQYYKAVFLKNEVTPLAASLIETSDYVSDFEPKKTLVSISSQPIETREGNPIPIIELNNVQDVHLKIETVIATTFGILDSDIVCSYQNNDFKKEQRFCLGNHATKIDNDNDYAFFFIIPEDKLGGRFSISIETKSYVKGEIHLLTVFN